MEGSSFNASPGPGTGSALLCSASLLVLSHQLGLVTPGRDPRQSASPPAYAEAQDPEVGTVPPLPSTDVFGRSLHGTGPIHQRVIVAAGSCSDCSAKTAEELIPKGRRLRETIVIYFDSLDKVKTHAAGIRNQALIVADPNLTLYRYLNAVWTPRYYTRRFATSSRTLRHDIRRNADPRVGIQAGRAERRTQWRLTFK